MEAKSFVLTEEQKKLVEANLDLVPYTINKYLSSSQFDFDDLRSFGYYALCRAAVTFDSTRNRMFSTYAIKCIIRYVQRESIYCNRQCRGGGKVIISLDEPIRNEFDEEIYLIDNICSKDNVEMEAINNILFEPIWNMCPINREIFKTGVQEKVIGNRRGISKQRINQLKKSEYPAIRKYVIQHKIA